MKLPVSFFDSKHTGDILQRMNDHSRIESFLTGSSLNTLFSLVNLIVFSIVLAIFNVYIFAVFLIASILYSAWVILFLKKRKQLDYKRFEIAAKEQSATIQMVQGMQEIKLNGVEKPMRWNWERLQAKLFKLSMRGLSINQWQQAGAFFINEGKNIFITFLSAKAVIDGQMTLGSMLAVQYIIGQLNSPIEQMIGFLQSWQNAKISMDRLNEIHSLEDEEPESMEFQNQLPAVFARRLVGGRATYGPLQTSPNVGGLANTQPLLMEDADKNEESLSEDGKLMFVSTLEENELIAAGQNLFYIQPHQTNYYAELMVAQKGFGKVRTGQEVILKTEGYPNEEYGHLKGIVSYLSNMPGKRDSFLVKVNLPQGLKTNYNQQIFFRNNLSAKAEIITDDRKLSDRLLGQLKQVWER